MGEKQTNAAGETTEYDEETGRQQPVDSEPFDNSGETHNPIPNNEETLEEQGDAPLRRTRKED